MSMWEGSRQVHPIFSNGLLPKSFEQNNDLGSASVFPFNSKENTKHIQVNARVQQQQYCGKIMTYWHKVSRFLKLKAIKLFACLYGNIHFFKSFFWVAGKEAFE